MSASRKFNSFFAVPLTGATVPLSASVTGAVTDIRYLDNVAYQIAWSGTLSGSMVVETSMDYDARPSAGAGPTGLTVTNAGTWDPVPNLNLGGPNGAAGHTTVNLSNIVSPFIRPRFTYVTGSGQLSVQISTKGA